MTIRLIAILLVLSANLRAAEFAGRSDLRVHDPSTVIRADGAWWLFGTGNLVLGARSTDLKHWQKLPPILTAPPAWAREVAPGNKGNHYWAPEVIHLGNRYLLYYSVSEFGKNSSAIALATATTLDSKAPGAGWTDHGIVIRSGKDDAFNAIDPSVLADRDGRLWMAFGSFWAGLYVVELDPATGLRITSHSPLHSVAFAQEIEAPTLYRREDYYYLFYNEGRCCRGKASTYHIRVGRSRSVTGPYLDDKGRDLMNGGGRAFLGTQGDFIGPGHAGLLRDADEREWVSVHFYDGAKNGAPTLALRRLGWTDDGWPKVID
jgi:arabinan endo-1,5-alpha-L-arabinosidase